MPDDAPAAWTTLHPRGERAEHARLRIFCFPCAGGEPGLYRDWPDMFDDALISVAHLRGRGLRRSEQPLRSIAAIVDELAGSIPALLDRPFVFFGHSMGGWLAYELARELRRRMLPLPDHVVLSASLPMTISRLPPFVHRMSVERLAAELRVLGGTPDVILDDLRALELYQPAIQADFEAFETHAFRPDTPLAVEASIWSAIDDPRVPVALMPLWHDLFDGDCRDVHFEGGHMFISDPASRVRLRQMLAAVIDRLTSVPGVA
ncbi:MAG: thioesterase II family protein [Salinarimonas sp.]